MSINLMTATVSDLEHIPGIDHERAQRLIDVREKQPLRTWEDLKKIPGFSDETIEALKTGGAEVGDGRSNTPKEHGEENEDAET